MRRHHLKKRLFSMMMDQEGVTQLTLGSLTEKLNASPEELMDLARYHSVQDAADKAWSLLAILAAPAAIAALRDSLNSEDQRLVNQAAKELLAQARNASKHQLEQEKALLQDEYLRQQTDRKARKAEDLKLGDLVKEARFAVKEHEGDQKGISSSDKGDSS